jgi:hypothetical protein
MKNNMLRTTNAMGSNIHSHRMRMYDTFVHASPGTVAWQTRFLAFAVSAAVMELNVPLIWVRLPDPPYSARRVSEVKYGLFDTGSVPNPETRGLRVFLIARMLSQLMA